MGYDLHIERDPHFSIDEWTAACAKVDGVRLSAGPASVVNPATGQTITMPHSEGDTEVFFGGDEWFPVFRFGRYGVIFKAAFDPDDESDPVRRAAAQLASELGATIRGDEGETYEW